MEAKLTDPLRTLIVEDNQVDQTMLAAMVTEASRGLSFVQTADTLQGALNLLHSYEFDVIILDLNLPDSQGYETIRDINKAAPKLAIVVNTGSYEEDIGIQTLRIGAQDFLIKGKYNGYTLNKTLHYAVERKRMELELILLYQEVKESQNQIVQMEKMKMVGTLASGVAHEVRNPLATVLYGVNYLYNRLESDDKSIKNVMDTIRESAEKANNIITDLLDFSHIDQLNKTEVNLNEIVEKSLSLIHHNIQEKNILIVKELDKQLPTVIADTNRIVQVLVNLLMNAIHAMPNKGSKIIIRSVNKSSNNATIIEIDDEGQGIDEEHINKIFDPFFTTRRANGGVGLGLFVCQNIMKLHDGTVFLKNRPEGGARATLTFKTSQ
ncbi:MAG: response regulator [Candidatus Omnitrophica bacterium]|nr:response regulator [Candidatus Omnitrophota bacterium]